MKKMNNRLVIFLLTTLVGIILCIPSFSSADFFSKIRLGLDLQGGLHMTLGVKTDEAVTARVKATALSLKYYCDKNDILIDGLKIDSDKIRFVLLDKDMKPKLEEFLKKESGMDVSSNALDYSIGLTASEVKVIREYAISQAI